MFLPSPLRFDKPVSLVVPYDPSKIPPGEIPYVYYLNETGATPAWERMEGNVVGPGLLETKTTHFSLFGAMSTKPASAPASAPSGGGSVGGGGGGTVIVQQETSAPSPTTASPTSPPAAKTQSISVEAEVVLKMDAGAFASKQGAFLGALAEAAGVRKSDAVIQDFSAAARRAGNTKIVSGIKADDPEAVIATLTLSSLNKALNASGLPDAASLTTRVVSGLSDGAVAAIVASVIATLLLTLAVVLLIRQKTPSKAGSLQVGFLANSSGSGGSSSGDSRSGSRRQPVLSEQTLRAFYLAWGRHDKLQHAAELARQYKNDVAGLNKILRDKYHGTDLTCSAAEVARRRREAEARFGPNNVFGSSTSSGDSSQQKPKLPQITNSPAAARAQAGQPTTQALTAFYLAWATREKLANVATLIQQHNEGRIDLNAILRSKYHGTDLSWSIADIHKKKAELARSGIAPKPISSGSSGSSSREAGSKKQGFFQSLFGGGQEPTLPRTEPRASSSHPLVASSAPQTIFGLQVQSSPSGSSAGSNTTSPAARPRTYSILNNAAAPRATEPTTGASVTAALHFPLGGNGPEPVPAPATLNTQIFSPVMGSGTRFGQDDEIAPGQSWNPDLSRVRDILNK